MNKFSGSTRGTVKTLTVSWPRLKAPMVGV
jgi:hypothetical protein